MKIKAIFLKYVQLRHLAKGKKENTRMEVHATQSYDGKIFSITGPMFAGKSKLLLKRVKKYTESGKSCLVVSPKSDERYATSSSETKILTHDGESWKCRICEDLAELSLNSILEVDLIAIDEAHFFPNVAAHCDFFANLGKLVLLTFPSGTFERKTFNRTRDLFAIAEHTTFLKATCNSCKNSTSASFTRRIGAEKDEIAVGGSEMYEAVCRRCYFRAQNEVRIKNRKRAPENGSGWFAALFAWPI